MFFKPGEDIPLYGDCSSQFSHLDKLSEIKPISPKLLGTISDFKPATELNLGPGIAKPLIDPTFLIEKVRAPGFGDRRDANHLNYEFRVPWLKEPLTNIHINLEE